MAFFFATLATTAVTGVGSRIYLGVILSSICSKARSLVGEDILLDAKSDKLLLSLSAWLSSELDLSKYHSVAGVQQKEFFEAIDHLAIVSKECVRAIDRAPRDVVELRLRSIREKKQFFATSLNDTQVDLQALSNSLRDIAAEHASIIRASDQTSTLSWTALSSNAACILVTWHFRCLFEDMKMRMAYVHGVFRGVLPASVKPYAVPIASTGLYEAKKSILGTNYIVETSWRQQHPVALAAQAVTEFAGSIDGAVTISFARFLIFGNIAHYASLLFVFFAAAMLWSSESTSEWIRSAILKWRQCAAKVMVIAEDVSIATIE